MLFALSDLIAAHSGATVIAALAICLTSGWLLAALLERANLSSARYRLVWRLGAAAVAGLGVWTTHFLAMIGYRPDLPLTYGFSITLISVLIGVVCVGLPLALAPYCSSRNFRAGLGATSGLGIAAMHFTGMSALSGCLQTYGVLPTVIACFLGAALMALCTANLRLQRLPLLWALLFSAAVGSVHFISIAGTTLEALPSAIGSQSDKSLLSVLIGIGSILLLSGTLLIILTAKRFDAQELAHATILDTALQNMSNGLVFINANGKLGLFNDRFQDLFQLRESNLAIGITSETFFQLVSQRAGWSKARHEAIEKAFLQRLAGKKLPPADHIMPGNITISIDSNPVLGGGVVFTFDDVTEERASRKAIADLAYNDPLTGLPNRRAFWQRKVEAFKRGNAFELLLVDLDRFKAVNDTFGHAIGDALLVEVGNRLRTLIGEDSFLARLGGDELAVLVEGDKERARTLAEQIIADVSSSYSLGSVTASVGCSIGICSGSEVANPDELVQCADVALYEAKRQGRGKFVDYRPGLLEAVAERHRLEADLREALPRGEFYLAYQPMMSLGGDDVDGYEALIRWQHPERGLVPPDVFIPLTEENGLIHDIGRWVLETACAEAATWGNNRHIAVNVSAVQLRAADFLQVVEKALADTGLLPSRLELELTETALVEDRQRIAQILLDLRSLGVKVAMDDFGTGYSSLAHLCEFPLDRIKIDRSFVAAAEHDVHACAIVKAVVALGRDIGVPTLAEGVETAEQLALLRGMGCDAVQGFLIGKPRPMAENTASSARPAASTDAAA
jgi:diguanylate cyclase (GGDEF)-like protein